MRYNYVRGQYEISFFSITLHIFDDLDSIQKLPENKQKLFFHEYLHFIQDITTVFGINSAWNQFDQIRQAISNLQLKKGIISLPIEGSDVQFILDNGVLYNYLFGDFMPRSKEAVKQSHFTIKGIRKEVSQQIEKIFPGSKLPFIFLDLTTPEGLNAEYTFGAAGIVETMAFLAQKKHYKDQPNDIFPYMIAVEVSKFIYDEIGSNEEYVYALCDFSLMYHYPGHLFYDLLVQMKEESFRPSRSEDIYEFGVKFLQGGNYDIAKGYTEAKDNLIKIISILFGHEVFKNERKWLITTIEQGYDLRSQNICFPLQIYRADRALSMEYGLIKDKLGTPNLYNLDKKRWFSAPRIMKEDEGNLQPAFLEIFFYLKEVLLSGKKACGMIDNCKVSQRKMPIDEKCIDSPWLKAKETPLCPFGGIWKMFGLDESDVSLKSIN